MLASDLLIFNINIFKILMLVLILNWNFWKYYPCSWYWVWKNIDIGIDIEYEILENIYIEPKLDMVQWLINMICINTGQGQYMCLTEIMIKLWASSLFVIELVASGFIGRCTCTSRTNIGQSDLKVLGDDRTGISIACQTVQMATAVGESCERKTNMVTGLFPCRCRWLMCVTEDW